MTKIAKSINKIFKLSSANFVSNILHQHQFSQMTFKKSKLKNFFSEAFFPLAEIARPENSNRLGFDASNDLFWALQERQKALSDQAASYKKRSLEDAPPSHQETFRLHPMVELKKRIFD